MKKTVTLYRSLLGEIKSRVREAQTRAVLSVNVEMIRLYWDVGRIIAERQDREGWGSGVIPRLASDLKNELPEEKGFSETNLKRMVQFNLEYPALFSIGAQPVPQLGGAMSEVQIRAQVVPQSADHPESEAVSQRIFARLSWGHNILLLQKVKQMRVRLWYAQQALVHGWSRNTLAVHVKNATHKRKGSAVSNFAVRLPPAHSELAQQLLKDPYIFDFLTLEEPFHERELETGLVRHIEKFLLELGRGFAFVGRQYRLEVGDKEYYLDLLFYNLQLRCFVVVDLKKGDFKPEFVGKMNFYCSVVDDKLRHQHDLPTLGLILCQTKDRILAEYALRDINKPIGVADYEITRALPKKFASSLPSIEAIEAELTDSIIEGKKQASPVE